MFTKNKKKVSESTLESMASSQADTFPTKTTHFIRQLLQQITGFKVFSLLCTLGIAQILYFLLPVVMGFLLDDVFIKHNFSVHWLLLFPFTWLASVILSSIGKFINSSIIQDVRLLSKKIVFKHIINLPSKLYSKKDAGEVEHLMQEVSLSARYLFSETLPFLIKATATFTFLIAVIADGSPQLFVIFLAWLIIFLPVSFFFAKKSTSLVAASLASSAKVSANTVDVIGNHELIPSSETENYEINRFEKILQEEKAHYTRAQTKTDKTEFFSKNSVNYSAFEYRSFHCIFP